MQSNKTMQWRDCTSAITPTRRHITSML